MSERTRLAPRDAFFTLSLQISALSRVIPNSRGILVYAFFLRPSAGACFLASAKLVSLFLFLRGGPGSHCEFSSLDPFFLSPLYGAGGFRETPSFSAR